MFLHRGSLWILYYLLHAQVQQRPLQDILSTFSLVVWYHRGNMMNCGLIKAKRRKKNHNKSIHTELSCLTRRRCHGTASTLKCCNALFENIDSWLRPSQLKILVLYLAVKLGSSKLRCQFHRRKCQFSSNEMPTFVADVANSREFGCQISTVDLQLSD